MPWDALFLLSGTKVPEKYACTRFLPFSIPQTTLQIYRTILIRSDLVIRS